MRLREWDERSCRRGREADVIPSGITKGMHETMCGGQAEEEVGIAWGAGTIEVMRRTAGGEGGVSDGN